MLQIRRVQHLKLVGNRLHWNYCCREWVVEIDRGGENSLLFVLISLVRNLGNG